MRKKLMEVDYRWFKCNHSNENDRDVIAIINLSGRESVTLSTAPQMIDVRVNR